MLELYAPEGQRVGWKVAFGTRRGPESLADSVRAQVEKIVVSDPFARSPNSIQFLRFIVNETLEGRGDELKESVVGTEVFKIKDFDSRVHTSVRKEATRLRERLEEYYTQAGARDAVRIVVPKGGYKPQFEKNPAPTPWIRRRWAKAVSVVLLVPLSIYGLWRLLEWIRRDPALPQQKHIAVLPFSGVDANPGSYELRLGLLHSLTSRLSQIERSQKVGLGCSGERSFGQSHRKPR